MEEFILKDGRKVLIRPIKPEDIDKVVVYLTQLAMETVFTNQYVGRQVDKEKYARDYENENKLFLGAFDERGRIIASSSIGIDRPDHPWCAGNSSFGVAMLKDYYGQGLGTRLMQLMEDWAKEHHLHTIKGIVRATNRRAINLYLKQGFEICGHLKETAFIDGVWHDEYIIQKIIKE